MLRQPLIKRKTVVNLGQYFDALRASVPGLSARSALRHRDIIEAIHARTRSPGADVNQRDQLIATAVCDAVSRRSLMPSASGLTR